MSDREYIKLNTSIQTGSNANQLLHDDEGNIEATVELRLPDNIFAEDGRRKIDKVEMQTGKMRLSMETTPFAAIPLDLRQSTEDVKVSEMQMDVYPYCLLDDNRILPDPKTTDDLAFPFYKDHFVTYKIVTHDFSLYPHPKETVISTIRARCNSNKIEIPTDYLFYDVLYSTGALQAQTHMMNLTIQSNHEPFNVEGSTLYVKHLATLEQMLQDGLQNAISFAALKSDSVIEIHLIIYNSAVIPDNIYPEFNGNYSFKVAGVTYSFWYINTYNNEDTCTNQLGCAFKPIVKLNEQSLTIAYDTLCFKNNIPILWNPAYIETWDTPEQLTLDNVRKAFWQQPPLKRIYQYGVNSTTTGYSFTNLSGLTCAVMNIIVNRKMAETLSFLPWVKVDLSTIKQYSNAIKKYTVIIRRHYKSRTITTSYSYQKLNTPSKCERVASGGYDFPFNGSTVRGIERRGYIKVTDWNLLTRQPNPYNPAPPINPDDPDPIYEWTTDEKIAYLDSHGKLLFCSLGFGPITGHHTTSASEIEDEWDDVTIENALNPYRILPEKLVEEETLPLDDEIIEQYSTDTITRDPGIYTDQIDETETITSLSREKLPGSRTLFFMRFADNSGKYIPVNSALGKWQAPPQIGNPTNYTSDAWGCLSTPIYELNNTNFTTFRTYSTGSTITINDETYLLLTMRYKIRVTDIPFVNNRPDWYRAFYDVELEEITNTAITDTYDVITEIKTNENYTSSPYYFKYKKETGEDVQIQNEYATLLSLDTLSTTGTYLKINRNNNNYQHLVNKSEAVPCWISRFRIEQQWFTGDPRNNFDLFLENNKEIFENRSLRKLQETLLDYNDISSPVLSLDLNGAKMEQKIIPIYATKTTVNSSILTDVLDEDEHLGKMILTTHRTVLNETETIGDQISGTFTFIRNYENPETFTIALPPKGEWETTPNILKCYPDRKSEIVFCGDITDLNLARRYYIFEEIWAFKKDEGIGQIFDISYTERIAFHYIKKITTDEITTEWKKIDYNDNPELIIPNLKVEQNEFYILDGTTANLEISTPEETVIETINPYSIFIETVQKETENYTNSFLEISIQYLDPLGPLPSDFNGRAVYSFKGEGATGFSSLTQDSKCLVAHFIYDGSFNNILAQYVTIGEISLNSASINIEPPNPDMVMFEIPNDQTKYSIGTSFDQNHNMYDNSKLIQSSFIDYSDDTDIKLNTPEYIDSSDLDLAPTTSSETTIETSESYFYAEYKIVENGVSRWIRGSTFDQTQIFDMRKNGPITVVANQTTFYACPALDTAKYLRSSFNEQGNSWTLQYAWELDTTDSANARGIGFSSLDTQYDTSPVLLLYKKETCTTTNPCLYTQRYRIAKKTSVKELQYNYGGNIHLTYTWSNLPIVVISPIQSIVLTLQGMQVTPQIQPINIAQGGGSSLTSTIPVVENFYTFAQTLRDLHDELVITRDDFADTATYAVAKTAGKERTLKFSAKYITKDGRLHQIFIPKNGVFSLQLIFGISFYSTV